MKHLVLLLAAALILAGCASQQTVNNTSEVNNMSTKTNVKIAAKGDTVKVDYIGKLEDGKLFDTSIQSEAAKAGMPLRPNYEPLEFTVGAGQMIAGFDAAVVGMKEGEEKTVRLAPEKAYGNKREEMIVSVPLENIGNSAGIKVGSQLSTPDGAVGTVTNISNGTATIDFNHELAGRTLIFTIKMVGIEKAS